MCVATEPCVPRALGYPWYVREEAIELALDHSISYAARTTGITYVTVSKWVEQFRLACAEIDLALKGTP